MLCRVIWEDYLLVVLAALDPSGCSSALFKMLGGGDDGDGVLRWHHLPFEHIIGSFYLSE